MDRRNEIIQSVESRQLAKYFWIAGLFTGKNMEYYRNLTEWKKYQKFFPKEYATDAQNAPKEEYWGWGESDIHLDIYESNSTFCKW